MNKTELIKQELDQIAEANDGLLRASDVVEFAKNPKTALHDRFDWDNTEAAHKWRLHQARQIIRVSVTVIENPKAETEYKAYVSLYDDRKMPQGGYRPFKEVMLDTNHSKQLLKQAHREFKLWQGKYKNLQELAPVFEAMDAVVFDEVYPMIEPVGA